MGTHPIFESDFDCLTESRNLKMKSILSCLLIAAQAKLTAKQRVAKLEEITAGGSKMAEIAATQFKDLVSDALDSKADYNIVLHYTALPERFGCKICAEFHSDMGYVAKAAVQGERKTYFLSLDFGGIQMQRAFQTMGIQNVPAVVVVDGRGGVPKDDMKLLSHEIRKERSLIDQVLAFLSKKAPEQ